MTDVTDTRAAYDNVAELYTELTKNVMAEQPFDRAMLGVFAELVQGNGSGPVADLGCGPGRVTAHLAALGLDAVGVDLSPRMIELARRDYPELRFSEGSLERLEFEDDALAGIVAWYSLIHLPPTRVPEVLAEFHRVVRKEGHVLLAFFGSSQDTVDAFDHKVIRAYRWPMEQLTAELAAAGFTMISQLVRTPGPAERFPQAYLLASKDQEIATR